MGIILIPGEFRFWYDYLEKGGSQKKRFELIFIVLMAGHPNGITTLTKGDLGILKVLPIQITR